MDDIKLKFGIIEDVRHPSYIEHKLSDVLIIIMCAVLSGLDDLAEIYIFAQNKAEFFQQNFGIDKIPSKPTLSRILNLLDGNAVAKVIIEIMKEQAESLGNILAIDGKAIRSTSKNKNPHSALQILTAYLTESGVVLGQKSINEKTNEIPVFQEMLDSLDVKGKTITADALHCQKETCKKIKDKGGNYVLGLKENQKLLFEDVELFFKEDINNDSITECETVEKNGGRIEKRICRKTNDISWLCSKKDWEGLTTVFSVRRIVTTKGMTSDETSFYISSLDSDAKELLKISREHWKIESMHWLLDVVFSEDKCAILSDNGQKSLNVLRKLALLLHKNYLSKQPKKCSVKASLLQCLIDDNRLLEIIRSL